MREKWISCLFHRPQLGTKLTTQAYALIGNQTYNLLVRGTMPNQLSHTGQDEPQVFTEKKIIPATLTVRYGQETNFWPLRQGQEWFVGFSGRKAA